MGRTRCKNCAHFKAPDSCALVQGKIDPAFWCEKFKMAGKGKVAWMSAQQAIR
jgi:hypothetical protein